MRTNGCAAAIGFFVLGCALPSYEVGAQGDVGAQGEAQSPWANGIQPRVSDGPMQVFDAGYVVAGPLYGHAWVGVFDNTATDYHSTVTPSDADDFVAVRAGGRLCISGVVAPDYESGAILGLNVAQANGSSAVGTWTPTGGGLLVEVANGTGAAVRVQLQGPGGENSTKWCASVADFGVPFTLGWGEFTIGCWAGGAHTPYAGEALESLMILINGTVGTETPFDVCLDDLRVVDL